MESIYIIISTDKKKGTDTIVIPATSFSKERKHTFVFNEPFSAKDARELIELGYSLAKAKYELKFEEKLAK